MTNKRILKHYVRYDGNHRIIPGGNILNRWKPKVGRWVEAQTYSCCNSTTTSTTTVFPEDRYCYIVYLHGNLTSGTKWNLMYCGVGEYMEYQMESAEETVCLAEAPILMEGIGTWDLGEICEAQ